MTRVVRLTRCSIVPAVVGMHPKLFVLHSCQWFESSPLPFSGVVFLFFCPLLSFVC
eukprot:m.30008 g.30008  ORF g.30008 m.30008 type:complete len:56 (+) comp9229_c0_seq1:121-288(+)